MLQSMSGAEDRKRSLVVASEDGPRKRLHSDESTPKASAANDDEDEEALHPAYAGLEAFRKEAIYRKLLEARRDLQRIERRAATFQDDLAVSEQRAAVLQRFWSLLLTDLAARLAVQDQDAFASLSPDSRSDLAAMEKQLQQQSTAVLQSLSKQSDVNVAELQQKFHDLAEEASRHKQDLFLTQSKLQRAEDALAQTTQKLSKVEHEYVRYQSNLLRATEGKATVPEGVTVTAAEAAPTVVKTEETAVKKEPGSPSNAQAAAPESSEALQKVLEELESARQDVELTRRESDSRYAEIQTLNEEVRALKYKLHESQTKLTTLPEEVLLNSALYRELQSALRHAQEDLRHTKEAMQTLETEASALREDRGSFQRTVEAEANARVEELEKLVKAKEADVTRLRSQRDELNAELVERRSREQVKFTQIEEMKALLNSKEERLTLLNSQVRRLRMTVAAFQGQSVGVATLVKADTEEDQFEQLSREAQAAHARVAELEKRLGEPPSASAAPNGAEIKVKTEEGVKVEEGAEVGVSVTDLRAENERLRLTLQAAEASSKAVDDELEKISAAYAELERQASVKVTDVSRMEEKSLRLVTEKSKADNKYFSTMRAKDSLEQELRTAKQVHERQQKTIEMFAEVERNYTAQLGLHEKEVTNFKKVVDVHSHHIEKLQHDLELAEQRLAESAKTKAAASDSAKELIDSANIEKDQRKRAEERIVRLEKDLESAKRQLAKAAASAAKNKGRRESEAGDGGSERDFLNALLQCSSCKERYRNRILTKCYHTFCSECIDSRVQTRQRKCPHCALAFAVSDVQPLYLQ